MFILGFISEHQSSGEVKAIASILNKYVFHLVHNCKQLLWFGYETVLDGMSNFPSVARQTLSNIPGHLFGEFLVMMTITQNYAPVVTSTSEGLPILGELLDYYDKFNKLMLDWEENDKQDLSWPDESSKFFIPLFRGLQAGRRIYEGLVIIE